MKLLFLLPAAVVLTIAKATPTFSTQNNVCFLGADFAAKVHAGVRSIVVVNAEEDVEEDVAVSDFVFQVLDPDCHDRRLNLVFKHEPSSELLKNEILNDPQNHALIWLVLCSECKFDHLKPKLSSSVYVFQEHGKGNFLTSGMLSEIYSVQGSGLIRQNVSAWSSTLGFVKENFGHVWDRRSDLREAEVKVVATDDTPYMYWVNNTVMEGSRLLFRGYFSGVAAFFREKTGITFQYRLDGSGVWGGVMANGSAYGMVGMISRAEVELGILGFSMNKERLRGQFCLYFIIQGWVIVANNDMDLQCLKQSF